MTLLFLASAATLFYKTENDSVITSLLSNYINAPIDTDWGTLVFDFDDGKVQLHRMKSEPGNFVSRTKIGLYNFMQKNYGEAINEHSFVKSMLRSDYAIGIILEPTTRENDERIIFLSDLLDTSQGIMFNGETLFNHRYELIEPLQNQ